MQNKQTDAIVAGTRQNLCQVYEAEQAMCRGTLFPELDKPLSGVRCDCSPCATWEHQCDFAAWELRLYLNTNPCDQQALKLYRQYCAKLNGQGYACVDNGCCKAAAYTRNHNNDCDKEASWHHDHNNCCDNDISFSRAARNTGKDNNGFIRVNGGWDKDGDDLFTRPRNNNHEQKKGCEQPDDDCCDKDVQGRWTWNDLPWPWEKCAQCRKED